MYSPAILDLLVVFIHYIDCNIDIITDVAPGEADKESLLYFSKLRI